MKQCTRHFSMCAPFIREAPDGFLWMYLCDGWGCCALLSRGHLQQSSCPQINCVLFQNYLPKSSDAGLEEGCFFSVNASVQHGKLPWVSWLHISGMNELNWKTDSLQRRDVFLSLYFLGQMHFHFYRMKDLRGLMLLNSAVKLLVWVQGNSYIYEKKIFYECVI